MEGGRSTRQAVVQGRGGAKFKNALAELAELRKSGGKRADNYEVREEEAVYDEVDDDEYARIVQKRREEGGGFVIGEDGMGYTDIGEEIDWVNQDAAEDGTAKGKGPKAAGSGAGSKRKAAEQQPLPGARARMQKMFQSATVKGRPAKAAVDDKSTDALLDDILGNLGADSPLPAPVATRPAAAVRHTPAAAASLRVFTRASARASLGTPKSVSFAPAPVQHTTSRATTVHRLASVSTPAPRSAAESEPADADMADYADGGFGRYCDDADGGCSADMDLPGDTEGGHQERLAAPAAAQALGPQVTPAPAAAAAAVKMPWRTPAGAAGEASTPATAAPVAGWQRMYATEDDGEAEAQEEEEEEEGVGLAAEGQAPWEDDGSLPLDSAARLPFYMLDAHEESSQPGVVYLFGKIPAGPPGQFLSCCAVVKGLMRSLFFVPREPVGSPEIATLHAAAEGGDATAKKALVPAVHAAFGSVKSEVRELLTRQGVTQMTMKPVMRQYAFENRAVPAGKHWVLKVRYPAAQPSLPLGITGDSFCAAFGTNQSALEALMLKRRVMGPSWVALRQPRRVEGEGRVSYCRVELEMEGHKAVFAAADGTRPSPPLTVAAVHLKTVMNPATATNEVAAASVVYLTRVNTDGPTNFSRRDLRHFSAVRRLDCHGVVFPPGFDAEVRAANEGEVGRRNGGAVLAAQPNERALLTWLVIRLRDVDADVFVGHNFAAFDLDVLLHRMQALKVPHWSSLGRLKRSRFPSLGGGGHTFGGGAGAGTLSVVAGRLLCDTYLAARDLVREVDYTLSTLSRHLLGEARSELASSDIPAKYATPQKLLELVRHTESDAWLSLRLAFYLVVLPLSRQLAELSGSLWSRALLNQRAQRIEMLLLHEFYDNKFLLPDKLTAKEKERLAKAAAAEEAEDDDDAPAPASKGGSKRTKGPQYAGGLVLEPKKGLYEKYVLLLDFNSLYPSIIQEYNICFTTVDRPQGGGIPALPQPGGEPAVLPRVIGALVAQRRRVKEMIKGERDGVKREQLNIRQQALKLLANSMYGCLGFANSRFYARPLAELITSQGREILQSTVDLVQGTVGREVIYGDTDSIMIYTGSDSLAEVTALGGTIKREVNKRYRLLEIEVDGVYKCMLLLKKKKYAAVKVERGGEGRLIETVEAKGLDMVRRDWSPLCKQASQFALDRILSCTAREDVVAAIHEHLVALAAAVNSGEVPLNKYIITKQLTKRPEDYPDAKNQPHVQVALRRKAAGKRDGTMPGETVPYVICLEYDAEGQALPREKGLAERAYSPDEVTASAGRLRIDAEYYLANQVFPVVSRLVAPIEGTDAGRLAECLGLDGAKYRGGSSGTSREDALLAAAAGLDDEDRFKSCDRLVLTSPGGKDVRFGGVRELLKGSAAAVESALVPLCAGGGAQEGAAEPALTPAQVANQVQLRVRAAIARYYEGSLRSDDDMLPCPTRNLCLRSPAEGKPGTAPPDLRCSGAMHQEVSEGDLYTQLSYYHRLFDVEGAVHALGDNKDAKLAAEAKLAPIKAVLDAGAAAAARFRDRSGYRWIDLGAVFGRA